MKTGNAALWKKQYIQENFANNQILTDSWTRFKQKLHDAFKNVGRVEDVMHWLTHTKQGSKSIKQFNTLFRINGQKAGYSFAAIIPIVHGNNTVNIPNDQQTTLIHYYEQSINPKIAVQIIIQGRPTNINDFMLKAAKIDSAFRRTNMLFSIGIQHNKKKPWKPCFYSTSSHHNDRGEPMDINVMDSRRTPF